MDLQEVLDKNYQWFIVEKHRQGHIDGDGVFDAVASDGALLRCAIGCCLPVGILSSKTLKTNDNNNRKLSGLLLKWPKKDKHYSTLINFVGNNLDKLKNLQELHDDIPLDDPNFLSKYKRKLRWWCNANGLKWPGKKKK